MNYSLKWSGIDFHMWTIKMVGMHIDVMIQSVSVLEFSLSHSCLLLLEFIILKFNSNIKTWTNNNVVERCVNTKTDRKQEREKEREREEKITGGREIERNIDKNIGREGEGGWDREAEIDFKVRGGRRKFM